MEELFADLERRLTDPASQERVLRKLGNQVLDAWRENILTSGHGTFAPLSDRTLREKIAGGYPLIPLIRERHLLGSMAEGGENNVFDVRAGEIVVGTGDPKAGWHKSGTERMPARDFSELRAEDLGLMADTTARWVRGEL